MNSGKHISSRAMYLLARRIFYQWYRVVKNLNFNQHRRVTVINASRRRLEDAGEWKNSGVRRWHRARGAREYSLRDSPSRRQRASATGAPSQTRYLRRDV